MITRIQTLSMQWLCLSSIWVDAVLGLDGYYFAKERQYMQTRSSG